MKATILLKSILIFCSFILGSCSHEQEQTDRKIKGLQQLETIKTGRFDNDSTVYSSDFFSDVKVIPLEFTSDCVLGEIEKIVIHDGHIYIRDGQNESGIFKFDTTGRFIQRIGRQGQGPQEHVELTDFSLNREANRLYIYDISRLRITGFSLDGAYLEEISLGHAVTRFEYNDSLIYLYRFCPVMYEDHDLIVKNMKGQTIAAYFKSDPLNIGKRKKAFSICNDTLYVSPAYCDTVYSLNKNSLYYSYIIDVGKYKIREDDLKRILRDEVVTFKLLIEKNYATSVIEFLKVHDLVYFTNTYRIRQNKSFYNTGTKKVTTTSSFVDDISYFYFMSPVSCTNDAFIGVYEPTSIDDNIKWITNSLETNNIKGLSREKAEASIAKLKSLKPDDIVRANPLLIMYYVK